MPESCEKSGTQESSPFSVRSPSANVVCLLNRFSKNAPCFVSAACVSGIVGCPVGAWRSLNTVDKLYNPARACHPCVLSQYLRFLGVLYGIFSILETYRLRGWLFHASGLPAPSTKSLDPVALERSWVMHHFQCIQKGLCIPAWYSSVPFPFQYWCWVDWRVSGILVLSNCDWLRGAAGRSSARNGRFCISL